MSNIVILTKKPNDYPLQSVYIKTVDGFNDMDLIESAWQKFFDPFPFTLDYLSQDSVPECVSI